MKGLRQLAMLALLGAGCVSKTSGISGDRVSWTVGETTRREVVSRWGNPDRTKGDVWVWKDWRLIGGKVKASYMMIGLTVSNARASTREYELTFDKKGVLRKQEFVDSVPGGAKWSPWPW